MIAVAPETTLRNVARFIRGITFKPTDVILPEEDNAVVCMRTKNVQADLDESDLIAIPPSFVRRDEQYLQNGDILVSSANSWELVGKSCWVSKLGYRATAGGFISILRADRTRVWPRYLYYWMTAPNIKHALRHCGRQTTNISNLSFDRALSLPLPLPYPNDPELSLPEQKRIAAILDKADTIRRKRRKQIRALDTFRQALLHEIMSSKTNEPKRIDEIADVRGGIALSSRRKNMPLQRPYLRVANVYRDRLDLSEVKVLGMEDRELEKTRLVAGDVLIVEGHGNREELGRSAVWDGGIKDCVHQNHLIRVRCNETMCTPIFLSAHLNSSMGRRQMLRAGKTTSGLNTISLSNVRSVTVHLPNLPIQHGFTQAVAAQEQIRRRLVQADTEADDLFNALVQRAFRGDL